jgi:hypothetical protein
MTTFPSRDKSFLGYKVLIAVVTKSSISLLGLFFDRDDGDDGGDMFLRYIG